MDVNSNLKQTTTADRLVGAGLLLMLISSFLPWYSITAGGGSFSGVDIPSVTVSLNGYQSWGWLYGLASYALIAFWVLRVLVPEVVTMPTLPLKDAMVYLGGGLIAVVGALLYHVHSSGSFSLIGWGWYVAMASVLAVLVGGYLMQQDPVRATTADPYRPAPPYSPAPPQQVPPQAPPQAPPAAPPFPPQSPPSGGAPPPPPR